MFIYIGDLNSILSLTDFCRIYVYEPNNKILLTPNNAASSSNSSNPTLV